MANTAKNQHKLLHDSHVAQILAKRDPGEVARELGKSILGALLTLGAGEVATVALAMVKSVVANRI